MTSTTFSEKKLGNSLTPLINTKKLWNKEIMADIFQTSEPQIVELGLLCSGVNRTFFFEFLDLMPLTEAEHFLIPSFQASTTPNLAAWCLGIQTPHAFSLFKKFHKVENSYADFDFVSAIFSPKQELFEYKSFSDILELTVSIFKDLIDKGIYGEEEVKSLCSGREQDIEKIKYFLSQSSYDNILNTIEQILFNAPASTQQKIKDMEASQFISAFLSEIEQYWLNKKIDFKYSPKTVIKI